MQKPETVFRQRVRRALKLIPKVHIIPIQQQARCGDPDYVLCVAGHFVGLELKTDIGIVSPLQEHELQHISECGGITFVARPSNWILVLGTIAKLAEG